MQTPQTLRGSKAHNPADVDQETSRARLRVNADRQNHNDRREKE